MAFKTTLKKALFSADITSVDHYDIEGWQMNEDRMELDLADETMAFFPDQEIEVDEVGTARANDSDGKSRLLYFRMSVPMTAEHIEVI